MPTLKELEEYMPDDLILKRWRSIASRLEAATDEKSYDQARHYGHGYAQALYDAGLIKEFERDDLRGAMLTEFKLRDLLINQGV